MSVCDSINLPAIALDTETANNIPFVATVTDEQLVSKLFDVRDNPDHYQQVKYIAENPNIVKVFHNATYDILCLSNIGINVCKPVECTLIMANLVDENFESRNLKRMAEILLNEDTSDEAELKKFKTKAKKECKKKGIQFTYDMIPPEILNKYAMKDTEFTMKLFNYFMKPIQKYLELYEMEKDLIWIIVNMIQKGLLVDRKFVKDMLIKYKSLRSLHRDEIDNFLEDLEIYFTAVINRKTLKGIYSASEKQGQVPDDSEIAETSTGYSYTYPIPFNPSSSSPHTRKVFSHLDIITPVSEKTGNSVTNAETLKKLITEGCDYEPFIKAVLDYRFYDKQLSTYYGPLYERYTSEDNHWAHFFLYQTGAKTGRFSAELIQTIPSMNAEDESRARVIRNAFIAPEGYTIVAIDYDQIEMRLFASVSECKGLIDAINNGFDPHAGTALEIFGEKLYESNKGLYRRRAKTINFGIIYGMGSNALAVALEMPYTKAQALLKIYHKTYPVKEYISVVTSQLYKLGYIRIEYNSSRMKFKRDYRIAQRFAYKGVNMIIQGSAAYVMKLGMKRVANYIEKNKLPIDLVLTVHDELLFYVRNDIYNKDTVRALVNEMEDRVTFAVPIIASPKVSNKTWGDCKELELD